MNDNQPDALYIGTTSYHILITLLKLAHTGQVADILLFKFAGNWVFFDFDDSFVQKLQTFPMIRKVYIQESSGFETWPVIKKLFFLRFRRKALADLLKPKVDNLEAYKDIYIYGDESSRSHYFLLTKTPYHFVEAQLNECTESMSKRKAFVVETRIGMKNKIGYWIKKYLFDDMLFWGQSKCCRSIEVNDKSLLAIPQEKVVEMRRDVLYKDLPGGLSEDILSLFFSDEWRSSKAGSEKRTLLLLPYSAALKGFNGDTAWAVRVFKEVVKAEEQQGYRVVMKAHPGEPVDWSSFFPDIEMVEADFPIEVFNLSDNIHFDRVVTISSTSMNGITFADEKVLYDMDYAEKYK
jgi:hypothetical protein